MRRAGAAVALLLLTAALSGCPRRLVIDEDAGGSDAGARADSGYDPVTGNRFDGPVVLDDQRMRELDPSQLRGGSSPCREPVLARIYRVIDGDTVRVRGESAVIDAPLRMIGIDTPEIARPPEPAQCYGDEAAAFTRQLLDRLVWITFDSSCFDHFDRLLGYVHVGAGEGDFWQRQLLRRGFATVLTVGDNRTYSGVFGADETFANMSSAGIWSACF